PLFAPQINLFVNVYDGAESPLATLENVHFPSRESPLGSTNTSTTSLVVAFMDLNQNSVIALSGTCSYFESILLDGVPAQAGVDYIIIETGTLGAYKIVLFPTPNGLTFSITAHIYAPGCGE